jgi:hypothetical protein
MSRNQMRLENDALYLLKSPKFFRRFLADVRRLGLVGESRNAAVLYIVAVSALLERPLNAILKGESSAGKNYLASRVLKLIPEDGVVEITSSSKTAWNYGADSFKHRVVYLQERNDATGAVHPVRLLISEGKLIRTVTQFENGQRVAKRFVAEGPISSISTTRRERIEIDDETRHVSLWMDESPEQTRLINAGYVTKVDPLTGPEIARWHSAYRLLEARSEIAITIPGWFSSIADQVFCRDVTARRYWPAFVEACKTVCLVRSFRDNGVRPQAGKITLTFGDYAVTASLFEEVFVESLDRSTEKTRNTRSAVKKISDQKAGEPVGVDDFARALSISTDQAYRRLRNACEAGQIRKANESSRGNVKLFLPCALPRFLPDPQRLLATTPEIPRLAEFVHPLTGEIVDLHRAQSLNRSA